jgi:hypothetical protein
MSSLEYLKETWNIMELQTSIKKEFHDNGPDNTKIFKVNGEEVRNTFKADFIGGGHNYVYKFIPENEIWIEDMKHPDDQRMILSHELAERFLMKHLSMSYEKAHAKANKLESRLRANEDPEVVFDEFCQENFKKPNLQNCGKQLALAYFSY